MVLPAADCPCDTGPDVCCDTVPEIERLFFSFILQCPEDACWRWDARRDSGGYAIFRVERGVFVAGHRWSCERWNGAIPDGYEVDHLCRNRCCVNPSHLEAVEPIVNFLRGQGWWQDQAGAWHCQRGHTQPGRSGRCAVCVKATMDRFTVRRRLRPVHRPRRTQPPPVVSDFQRHNIERFLSEHPEIPRSEIDVIGLKAAVARLRYGWEFRDLTWWKPGGIRVVEPHREDVPDGPASR